jgi:hypothetical protein
MTMMRALLMGVLGLLAAGVASADPGDCFDDQPLEVLPAARPCASAPGTLCLRPGAPSTVAVPAAPTAMNSGTRPPVAGAPGFARAQAVAGVANVDGPTASPADQPWTVDVDAHLRRRAWAGNALFLVYDAEEAGCVERREVAALWQAPIAAADQLSARLTFSPGDGFHADHTYRLRIVQLIGGKEVLLADGELRLR